MPVKMTVNGKPVAIEATPDTPLLWALRDILHLHGTKYGCGIGMCGACTVHLNGQAVRSCQTTIAEAAGKRITTIEGLSPDGSHPVQVAWREVDVPQCGYCQAGQIMSAASLLAKTPRPTEQQILDAMDGNLCRCGTYVRIHEAVKKAATMTPEPRKSTSQVKKG
ncbi:MAG: (2Fe-2S)-binding protein [bacterium]|jgi:isoquinoline 1-oxidoreductase alpha subunit